MPQEQVYSSLPTIKALASPKVSIPDSGFRVPSAAERSGNLFRIAAAGFTTVNQNGAAVPATVNGSYWASQLSQKLGLQRHRPASLYYFRRMHQRAPNACSLCAAIPQSAWSAPASHLLAIHPRSPTSSANGTFSTSSSNQALTDDKGAVRLDGATRWGQLSAYYFLDGWSQNNPYPVAQGGANVPGFNALNLGRAQLLALGDTKTIGASAVNEVHLSIMRDATKVGQPVGGVGASLASQGFVVGLDTPGIVPLSPKTEGVESINFNNFSIGTNTNELRQVNNTIQANENFSKISGAHTIGVGLQFHYDQVNVDPIAQLNGNFIFYGSETGSDFADFLLGIPSQYNQSQLQSFYGRNKYVGLYAQDSWRIRQNLTLNYGLRWDRIEPWYEKYDQVATFEPGRQSVVFPGAPAGILFPTDPGVPRTLAPAGNLDFAPRIGLAYSPGSSGKTSFRASFGMFYTAIEALTIGIMSANAPYGTTYTSPASPVFSTPFITASNGQNVGQYFPVQLAPLNTSASHPDANVDWSQFVPISGVPAYPASNRIPYTSEYMFSIEHGFSNHTVLNASYVGTQSHRLLVLLEANPSNPALCLQAGPAVCGPFNESGAIRSPLGPNFGSDTLESSTGNSNYNSLQVTLRHSSGPLQLLAAYTYSKSLDQSSNLAEAVNPVNPSLSRALSAFDLTQNFVASLSYQLPGWAKGWEFSGITRFSTGLPVTLINYGDNSLLGAEPNGINNYGVDEPDVVPGSLQLNRNPRNGAPYFNTALFGENALGTRGDASRRYFHGPGMQNFDMALLKTVRLTESKSLQLRLEAFNVFNHAQFFGPQSVDGNITSSTFGQVGQAPLPALSPTSPKIHLLTQFSPLSRRFSPPF